MNVRIVILLAALPLAVTAFRSVPQEAAATQSSVPFMRKYCTACHDAHKGEDK